MVRVRQYDIPTNDHNQHHHHHHGQPHNDNDDDHHHLRTWQRHEDLEMQRLTTRLLQWSNHRSELVQTALAANGGRLLRHGGPMQGARGSMRLRTPGRAANLPLREQRLHYDDDQHALPRMRQPGNSGCRRGMRRWGGLLLQLSVQ